MMKRGIRAAALFLAALPWIVPPADGADLLTAGGRIIVRAHYPTPALGRKTVISFEGQLLSTDPKQGYHVMTVTPAEIELLTAAGLRVEAAPEWRPPSPPAPIPRAAGGIPGYPCYRTVEETYAAAEEIAADHPGLATWVDAGDSWEKTAGAGGYDLRVLRLTNADGGDADRPKLLVTAAMHAREYATAELVLRFAERLVADYDTDPDATWILDHHEIHLMFHMNPDGRKQAETGLWWRKNTNRAYCDPDGYDRGADLNRNFPFRWGCCGGSDGAPCGTTYRGPAPASEPETQAVRAYLSRLFPDRRPEELDAPAPDDTAGLYIDIHSYSRLVLWPWGSNSDAAPNGTQLTTLGRKLAYWNGYTPEQSIGLYPTDGTAKDHAYGTLGVAAFLFEIGTRFFQPCADFEATILPDNLPALRYAARVVRAPYLLPAGPDAAALFLDVDSVPPGTPVTLFATLDDTRYNHANGAEPSQPIAEAEYAVDTPFWADGAVTAALSPSDGRFDTETEDGFGVLETSDLTLGRHFLYVRGRDTDGNWGPVSAVFLHISRGDLDADGEAGLADAVLALRILAGNPAPELRADLENGDPDGNGRIGMDDLLTILRGVAGI